MNNPIKYTDPSGHCATDDEDCWQYLNDRFCQGLDCGTEGWSSRVIVNENSIWTREELTTLHDALSALRLALDNIGINWQDTALGNTRFQRAFVGDSFSLPWNVTVLTSVSARTIWHEAAHQLDWENLRMLSNNYLYLADACFLCGQTPDGFYFRDYGWDAGESSVLQERVGVFFAQLYGFGFGRMEPFADAFSAWVYNSANDQYPTGWTQGRAAEPQFSPSWKDIIGFTEAILKVSYSD